MYQPTEPISEGKETSWTSPHVWGVLGTFLALLAAVAALWYAYKADRDARCNKLSAEGIQCAQDGDWQTAARRLKSYMDECADDCMDDCRAISYYVDVCIHEDRLQEAEKWTSRLLELDPRDPEGLYFKGLLLSKQKKFSEALPLLAYSVPEVRDNHPNADFYLGVTYIGLQRYSEGCQPLSRFRARVPIDSQGLTDQIDKLLAIYCAPH